MRSLWSCVVVLVLLAGIGNASAKSAADVYKDVEPSIVLIGNLEGFGSGVVLNSSGTIITNHHVVNTVLPLTVKAKVYDGNRLVEKEFKNVKVYRIHKKYDLALLKIESKYRFKKIAQPRGRKIATGSKCYVIGNPDSGQGKALRNSITDGLISSNSREIEGLDYLQISAAINPGNSGGAVVDNNGVLAGIVTFKVTDKEGMGFAIPFSKIKSRDFIESKKKVGNRKLGLEYEKKGKEFFERAQRTANPELKKLLFYCAHYYYRLCLAELPGSSAPYHNVGLMYYNLGEPEIAKAYFKKTLEMEPKSTNTLHMYGIILIKEDKVDEAQKLWLKGAFANGPGSGSCAENAAITTLQRKQWVSTAYLARLALVVDRSRNMRKKEQIFSDAAAKMSGKTIDFIRGKNKASDFTLAEMQSLAKGETKFLKVEAEKVAEREQKIAAENKAFAARLEKSLSGRNKMPDEWISKKIPGEATDMIPAYGGVVIALSIKDLKKIVLLHSITGNKTKYLNVASTEYLMAAADRYLFVYHPSLKIIEKFDVLKVKKISAKRLKSDAIITLFLMGLRNAGTAFVSYSNSTGALDRRFYGLLDLDTGRIRPLTSKNKIYSSNRPNRFNNTSYRDDVRVSADNNLEHLAMWCTSHSPSGYEYVTLDTKKAMHENTYEHSSFGGMSIASDGEFVFTTSGYVFQKYKKIKQMRGSWLYCVHDGSFFVQFGEKEISIRETYSLSEVRKFEPPFKRDSYDRYKSAFKHPEKLVLASALTNRISILDTKTNTVHTRPLLPPSAAGKASTGNSLFASRGKKWTFELNLPQGFTAKLEDAPEGVKLSGGALTWSVPGGETKGVKEILVSVKDAEGNENYRVIKAMVR